jgi:hypothetical protein
MGDYLYLFGGHSGTHTRVERNDFWRYHVPTHRWEQLDPGDNHTQFGAGATHPGARRVPILESTQHFAPAVAEAELAKAEPVKAASAVAELVEAEPVKAEPAPVVAEAELVEVEPAEAASAVAELAEVEPAKAAPAVAELAEVEPVEAAPAVAELAEVEPVKAASAVAELVEAELAEVEPVEALLFGGLNCFIGPERAGRSLPLNDLWIWRPD